MSDRKGKILDSALELFANVGYDATATLKIAQHAGVSEGLIFKHFGNKKGLLNALIITANQKLQELVTPILREEDPKKVIRQFIELPFGIDEAEHNFWRLQFKLKWEQEYDTSTKMDPLKTKLEWAFTQLQIEAPKEEAHLLAYLVDAISTDILRLGYDKTPDLRSFLLAKYQV